MKEERPGRSPQLSGGLLQGRNWEVSVLYYGWLPVPSFRSRLSRYIKLEEVPCPDQLLTTLTYLYTGKLPPSSLGPDTVFGLLQNAHYLICDRLAQDCSNLIIKELKRLKGNTDPNVPSPWIFHEAFKLEWVSVEVVKSLISFVDPRQAVRVLYHWLMGQTSV